MRDQRVKAVNFNLQKPQKLISYHGNVPWATAKLISFVIPIHVTTYAEILVKIGFVVVEVFGGICHFLHVIQKDALVTLAIFGVTVPILIICAQDVATILPLNIC